MRSDVKLTYGLNFPKVEGHLFTPPPVDDSPERSHFHRLPWAISPIATYMDVSHPVMDTQLAQPARQPVVTIEANLQSAGQPCRHTHLAETQFLVHEVEVVMQTLPVIRNQICLAGLFVVSWLIRRAGLHGRENADQPRLLPATGQNLFHPVFLPEIPFADELDFDSRLGSHLLRVLANPVAEWFGELRIIEYPDLPLVQKRRHPAGKADLWQCAENQHPIPTPQHPGYLPGMTFRY